MLHLHCTTLHMHALRLHLSHESSRCLCWNKLVSTKRCEDNKQPRAKHAASRHLHTSKHTNHKAALKLTELATPVEMLVSAVTHKPQGRRA